MFFWFIVLGGKFTFAYFLQIRPLVKPTRIILDISDLRYSWHDFVSKSGDLHVLRQKQPSRYFSEQAAREQLHDSRASGKVIRKSRKIKGPNLLGLLLVLFSW